MKVEVTFPYQEKFWIWKANEVDSFVFVFH